MSLSFLRTWLLVLCVAVVAGCGGGGGGDAGTPVLGNGAGTPVVGGGSTNTVAVSVQLLRDDGSGQPTTALIAGSPVRAVATVTRNGQAVPDQIVQFTLDPKGLTVAALDPVSGAILTDENGVASLKVSSLGTATSAGQVIATATVKNATGSGSTSGTGSANFFATGSVGAQPGTLTLGPVTFDSSAVSAYGTTGVKVQVLQNGAPYTSPVTVTFTTSCAAGKATMTPNAISQPSGYAVGTFVDNGCAQVADALVTITATISTGTAANTLTVKAPTAGSLRFVSATPSDKSITLRGQGGQGRQENAALVFQLVDLSGNGVADTDVCFESTTYVGDLNLDGFGPNNKPSPQGSDALCGGIEDTLRVIRYVKRTGSDGKVSIQINSGTVPTPVRVRARTLYPSTSTTRLETYSDTLSISTGLPLQRSFSLSVNKANIDGGSYDGEIARLTVRLADQFSNPVPDGTVVNFIGSGASVCTADNGSCKTTNGACTCDVTSQARRPLDNRVVVTAYAVGLEDFDDVNANNQYDLGENYDDLSDVFVDANKDGQPGAGTTGVACPGLVNPTINGDTDILVPYQNNTGYRCVGDGVRGTAHIRASTVIYLSLASSAGDPTVMLPLPQLRREYDLFSGALSGYFLPLKPDCPEGAPVPQATLSMLLEDGWGNPMAAETRLLPQDPSDNVNPGEFRPSLVLAEGARAPSPLIDQPTRPKILAALNETWIIGANNGARYSAHTVVVRGVSKKCFGNASFALSVQSPRGGAATARVLNDGESRDTSRFAFDVRYRDVVTLDVSQSASLTATINSAQLMLAGVGGIPESYSIDWGDGSPVTTVNGATIASADSSHTYPRTGFFIVKLTVKVNGISYSRSTAVTIAT